MKVFYLICSDQMNTYQGCRGYGNSHGDPHTHGNGNQIFPVGIPMWEFPYGSQYGYPRGAMGCRGYESSHGDPHTHGNRNQIFPVGIPIWGSPQNPVGMGWG